MISINFYVFSKRVPLNRRSHNPSTYLLSLNLNFSIFFCFKLNENRFNGNLRLLARVPKRPALNRIPPKFLYFITKYYISIRDELVT